MKNKITPWDILNYSLQNIFFKGIEVDIAGVQKSEETIANFQWFLRRPSPLNVFGRSDHCHQWFYDGFLMLLPSLSMVFDGSRPLVKRCDGFDGSLWSNHHHRAQTPPFHLSRCHLEEVSVASAQVTKPVPRPAVSSLSSLDLLWPMYGLCMPMERQWGIG